MSQEPKSKQAKAGYNSLRETLDGRGVKYSADESKLTVLCKAAGNELPDKVNIKVDKERKKVLLTSSMPFTVPENQRNKLAVAASAADNGIDGVSFVCVYKDGAVKLKTASSANKNLIIKELFTVSPRSAARSIRLTTNPLCSPKEYCSRRSSFNTSNSRL